MDWIHDLDFDTALYNCFNDIIGDWYRDPWSWPELEWVVHQRPELIIARLNSTGARGVAKLDVAKENFGIRPAVVLDPVDRISYQALVDSISTRIIGEMPRWAYGWRLPTRLRKDGRYSRNDFQWRKFVNRIEGNSNSFSWLLKTDIVSFFSSVQADHLSEMLFQLAGTDQTTDRLASMLRSWDKVPGRSGLPQRSAASAVLANMYLSPVDKFVQRSFDLPGEAASGGAVRWMDDIWLFGNDESQLRGIQLDLQITLRTIGLELNAAKTNIFSGQEVRHEAERLDFTGLDYMLHLTPLSPESLNEFNGLIEQVVVRPESASRTLIKFVTTRMRSHELYERLPDLISVAHRMPQGSDSLARLFRDSGAWRNLIDWYMDYAKGPWGKIDWAVAQLGTMFPVDVRTSLDLEEFFTNFLMNKNSIALTALGAQRLAAWRAPDAAYILREAATLSDNPLHRRVLALASLQAGESRPVVRRMLSEFEENAVTLHMLEDRRFRPPKSSADFLGQSK